MEYPKDYLGDGVYALYDGFGINLHANDHRNPTDRIYLEPAVLDALNKFDKRCTAWRKEHLESEIKIEIKIVDVPTDG